MKRGNSGDASVWWSNTRHMLKAYIKHLEMAAHGSKPDDPVYQLCKTAGVLRVELELKKRLLSDLGLNDWDSITDEKLESIFRVETDIFNRIDRSDELDILEHIPVRSRAIAAAWLSGSDVATLVGRSALYVHAKRLREYGLDILEPRNLLTFPVKVRVVDLTPLEVPEWYWDYSKKESA